MGQLILDGVVKRFGKIEALRQVDLEVRDGEFFVILGPSAAGKTTTLRAIAGLEKLDAGRIVLDGDPQRLLGHKDIQEFYLGRAEGEDRRSYRDVKQYRRSRRWYG